MKVINPNKIVKSDSKIPNKTIYSKIAPPNTFQKRNPNQILKNSKIYKRYDKSPQISPIMNPYLNNTNNELKNSFLSKSINSGIIKGNIFLNKNKIDINHKSIITPKKLLFGNIKVKNNKIDYNKYKTERQNISNKYNPEINIDNNYKNKYINLKGGNLNSDKNNDAKKRLKYENNNIDIKEKYNFLLQKTKNLLNNYQKIIEYYQQKEKNS